MTQAAYVANIVTAAQARGVSDPEALRRLRSDAIDFWQSRLNASYSGEPSGSSAPD
jgi:hypothetical protein